MMADADSLRRQVLIQQLKLRGLGEQARDLEQYERVQELSRRGLLSTSFESLVSALNPDLLKYEHVPKLIDIGERIIQRKLDRVMVLMPPRYFKSTIFTQLLPAAYLARQPIATVAISAYTAHLAWEMSVKARENFRRSGGKLGEMAQAKAQWSTDVGGELWAVGMGGTIVGRGYHLGILDDPISPEHATSATYQRSFRSWWPETWLSRQEPHMGTGQLGAQIVVVMQRLGPSDPIDFLLRREVGEQTECAPMHWHVVIMDEIKSEEPLGRWNGPRGLPPTCTIEPDDRKVGQVLSPSRFSPPAVQSAQAQAGPLATAAQRQQRPMKATGLFWRSSWFGSYEKLPDTAYNGATDWDTAYSQEEGNAASAFVRSFRGPPVMVETPDKRMVDQHLIYIDDVDWEWFEFPALVAWMKRTMGPHFIEAKASGKSASQTLKAYGISAQEVTVAGDKLARASKAQPIVSSGRVLVRGAIMQKLLSGERQGLLRVTAEALQVGGSEGLDVNDAFVQALHRHAGLSEEKRLVRFR